ncbi:MAG: leucine-rich repeat protein [Oscillospiraceae bacterium]
MKNKRLTAGLLAFAMVFGMGTIIPKQADFSQAELTASALSQKNYKGWYYYKYGRYIGICGYEDSTVKSLEIPTEIENLPVTRIEDGAFYRDYYNLTTVLIPDTVTTIGNQAFWACPELSSIHIPDGVTTIGDRAFFACNELSSINIPDGVTTIGADAFRCCEELTEIVLPEGITSIEPCTFYSCGRLMKVTIPEGVTTIGNNAFGECPSLEEIYYAGTEKQWNEITIDYGNDILDDVIIHFSDTESEKFSVADVIALHKALKSGKGAPKKYDLNGDNVVNVIDLALLKRALLNK